MHATHIFWSSDIGLQGPITPGDIVGICSRNHKKNGWTATVLSVKPPFATLDFVPPLKVKLYKLRRLESPNSTPRRK